MKIWAVSNQKGGVGKTTTVVALGGLLSAWGYRTLLVDLDSHGALTSYFKMNPDGIEGSVYNLFHDASLKRKDASLESYIVATGIENLSILPASTALATLDRQVASMNGMGLVIANALKKIEDQYDYVIIDSPPVLGILMINALAACERLILPVLAEFLALQGLDRMLRTLKMVFNAHKHPPNYIIVPTMFDKRTKEAHENLQSLNKQYPDYMWGSVIPIDTKFREASRLGIPGPLYVPTSKASEAYAELLEVLLQAPRVKSKQSGSGS
ncbi:MAG: ParA family protein [Methylococcales bacterium]|nr:ParA family protein [Methylococcales bacterium]